MGPLVGPRVVDRKKKSRTSKIYTNQKEIHNLPVPYIYSTTNMRKNLTKQNQLTRMNAERLQCTAKDRDRWQALVNAVMNLRDP